MSEEATTEAEAKTFDAKITELGDLNRLPHLEGSC